jgi:non-heme chloroperoxidase
MHVLLDPTILPGGVRLPHSESGDRDGTPVLMLHGLSDSERSFDPIVPYLPRSVRALAATQRGHGHAPKPLTGYRVEELAGDARALLDLLEIERAVIVGHSLGAWVATKFAAQYPDRVSGLLLEGALGPVAANPGAAELFSEIASLEDPVDPAFVEEFQAGTVAGSLPAGMMDGFVAESMKLPARVWREVGRGFADVDLDADLGRISAKTRIVWGDQDPIATSAEQEHLVNAIPDAELSVYPGVGHAVHWEQPERFAEELASFALAELA